MQRGIALGQINLLIKYVYLVLTAPPIFLVQPMDQKVAVNSPVTLDCIAAGNPTPTLFWMKEGSPGIIMPDTQLDSLSVTPEGTLRIGKAYQNIFYECVSFSTP